jgi:MinD-like ATPase involved in chromosome partitioning or flagellar assembly
MYVVTFYSFKGGVGRTMALVNVATELAARGKRILVVDFDLEAPGVQTYAPFSSSKKNRGIVEYVTQFMFSGEAPDVRDFILKNSINDKSIWLMPSGFQDENYARRLNSIDWLRLYEDYNGYLMFEDLKQQWRALKFDYVLIDSRTGHTDVGGICTRQLPDAAVLMFVPNDQNLVGMEVAARNIRAEKTSSRKKVIHCHFCPSNVPDLDDEELVLQRQLHDAEERLGYIEPASVIHHYNSLALLDQAVFVRERPRTHLAAEYRQLVKAIVAENLEDRSGALSKLERIMGSIESDEPKQGQEVEKVLEAVFKHHPDDGELAWLASRINRWIGNSEGERVQLNIAIRNNFSATRARFRRAMLPSPDSDADTVREDLHFVLKSPEAKASDITASIRKLRKLDKGWLEIVAASPAVNNLKGRAMERVAEVLTEDRMGAQLAAKMLLGQRTSGSTTLASTDAVLALVGAGEYQKVIDLLGGKSQIFRCRKIELVFNFACAEWGLVGVPPVDVFEYVLKLAEKETNRDDSNFQQCLAMTYYLLGKYKLAGNAAVRAKKSLSAEVTGSIFSCWRYLWVNTNEFAEDLREMEGQMAARQKLLPSYLREPALSVE